jgi:hypothetical protein
MTEDERRTQAIDIIAAMVYQTQLNIDCLAEKIRKIPPSSLKDVVICYLENQRSWMQKFNRGLKMIGALQMMQRDLTSEELAYYSIICEFSRQGKDMESLADLVEIAADIDDLSPVLTQIKAILFNHQQKSGSL